MDRWASRAGRVGAVLLGALIGFGIAPGLAYTPGSGNLFKCNFEGTLDADWEQGNGISGPSPWQQTADGTDSSFYADGKGPLPTSPTKHWARHFLAPVPATGFSIAMEYRSALGTTYTFDLDIEQRAPVPRKIRLHVAGNGTVSLWRTEAEAWVQKVASAAGLIPAKQKRWIKLAIESGTEHPLVRAKVWSGGATAEPAGWTLEFIDDINALERVHRFELTADGPKGVETWIDDLDSWGDKSAGVVSSIRTIYVTEWSHLDIGFTEPPDDIETFAKTSLDQVLDNLDADPSYRFTIEESYYLERWWERSDAAQRQRMVAALKSRRMALAAGYATLHTTTAAPEELTRLIYYSRRFGREHQVPVRTFIQDDVPGATFALPELLARSGVEFYINGMNTPFGGKILHPNHGERPFWWVGPDGSRVLSWHTFDSYAEGLDYGFSFFDGLPELFRKLGKKLPEQEEAGYPYPEWMMIRAFDNHYSGFKVRDLVNQWNATYAQPKFILATPEEFFDHMLTAYGADRFPSFSGDFGPAWSQSHANAPRTEEWVRTAHRRGRASTALAAVAGVVDGAAAPLRDIDFLYEQMLNVDEHSGAGAWPGYFTPEELDRNNRIHLGYARDAVQTAERLETEGLDRWAAQVAVTGETILVANPLGRARDGWVRVALPAARWSQPFHLIDRVSGAELAYQTFADKGEILFRAPGLPAVGFKTFSLVDGEPTVAPSGILSVSPSVLENDFYRLEIDGTDGAVVSLIDKKTGRQLVDGDTGYRFNSLASAVKKDVDAAGALKVEPVGSAVVTVIDSGPLLGEVQVTRTGTPHAETIFRLYRGEDRVEIENALDRDRMPYVNNATSFRGYTVALPFKVHNFEIRAETTTRFLDPLTDNFARDSWFDWYNTEHSLTFWDGEGGIVFSCDASDAQHFERWSTFPPNLIKRGHGLLLPRLYDRSDEIELADHSIGPMVMEPDTAPIFRSRYLFQAIPPGFDPPAVSRFGYEALNAPLARYLAPQVGTLTDPSGSFFAIDAPNVLLYTVAPAVDGDGLILRLLEQTEQPTVARISSGQFVLDRPEQVAQDEGPGTPLTLDGGAVVVPFTPYETVTVRVRAALPATEVLLQVASDRPHNVVHLSWTGGRAPFRVLRSSDPQFSAPNVLVDGLTTRTFDDPVLDDGRTWFYRVEGGM